MKDSTKHHYVPQWYQRRFLPDGETRFFYLNLDPVRTVSGRKVAMRKIERWGPAKCFQQPDLYSVYVPGFPKDLFERVFFGEYDLRGSAAVAEVSQSQPRQAISRDNYTSLFEYLTTQALRTPKGLAWLRLKLGRDVPKRELLEQMAYLRHMRGVMWLESFQEILYTNSQESGFILTDHPVTSYNKACYSASSDCRFPNDPDPAWKGTQTIFPLDAQHCFVMTHTEYAHNQRMNAHLKRPRTNARLFGNTIAATHQIVHREITDQEVCQVNQILKLRAKRFIASATEEWLYPEKRCARVEWPTLGDPLVPKTELWRNTGEIYIGMQDGSVYSQDRFGRAPRTAEEQHRAQERAREMHERVMQALAKNPSGLPPA